MKSYEWKSVKEAIYTDLSVILFLQYSGKGGFFHISFEKMLLESNFLFEVGILTNIEGLQRF